MMPGRAVDIVHAAVLAARQVPVEIAAHFADGTLVLVDVQLGNETDEADGRAVLAQLAATGSFTIRRYSGTDTLGDIRGHVAALGVDVRVMAMLTPADVDTLVATVDAARAAEEAAGPPVPTVVIRSEGPDSPIALRISPDCAAGKCSACTGDAWDCVGDQLVGCEHDCHGGDR